MHKSHESLNRDGSQSAHRHAPAGVHCKSGVMQQLSVHCQPARCACFARDACTGPRVYFALFGHADRSALEASSVIDPRRDKHRPMHAT